MPVTAAAIILLLAVVAIEAVVRPSRSRSGWPWFLAWSAAGILSSLAVLSFAIGLVVLPFALLLVFAVSRFALWPDVVGLGAGAGITAVAIAGTSVNEPGGPDAQSWFVAGLLMVAGSASAYARFGRRVKR